MFDAVEIERRGIPTITITHNTFEEASRLHAETMGLPSLPLLVEPLPESGIVSHDVDSLVRQNEATILSALVRAR